MLPIVQSAQSALQLYATQQFVDVITEALQALNEHQYDDHEFDLMNIFAAKTDVVLLQATHDCLMAHLFNVCKLHRIIISEDADISSVSKFVRAIMLMQTWSDGASIVALCESDATAEDILASVVALVGELTEVAAAEMIEEVDQNFIKGLSSLYTAQELATELLDEVSVDQIAKLKLYRDSMKAEKALAYRMIKAGYKPGYAFKLYLDKIVSSLVEKENKDIASEMVPFLFMGRDSWQNPIKAWRDHSFLLGVEPTDITAIDAEILKLLGEFDRLSTQVKAV